MRFQDLKESINNTLEFPEITEEDAIKAYMAALIKITNKNTAFYFFASMNLLNAYVKKPYVSDEFKKDIDLKTMLLKVLSR